MDKILIWFRDVVTAVAAYEQAILIVIAAGVVAMIGYLIYKKS